MRETKKEVGDQLVRSYEPDEYVYKSGEGLSATYGTDLDVSYVEQERSFVDTQLPLKEEVYRKDFETCLNQVVIG